MVMLTADRCSLSVRWFHPQHLSILRAVSSYVVFLCVRAQWLTSDLCRLCVHRTLLVPFKRDIFRIMAGAFQ